MFLGNFLIRHVYCESEVAQLCPTLRPMDCGPPSSSIHGILQARILEWVAISFIQVLTSKISREERKPGRKKKREEGGGRRRGQKGWPYRRLLPPADTQVLWDFTLGLRSREDWNSALPGIRPEQNQNLSSLPRGGDQSPILSSG